MSSAQTQVADAVKSELDAALVAGTLTTAFASQRTYAPTLDPVTMTGVMVFVGSTGETVDLFGENTTRASCEHDYPVQLAIYAKAQADDVASLDSLSLFREQVIDLLKSKRILTALAAASLVDLKNPQSHDPSILQKDGLFVALITATYRILR
jgi:hypothetical protein